MRKGWIITIVILILIFLGIFVFNKLNPIKMTGNAIDINECGFVSSIVINDSLGDASLDSPNYVDIKSLKISQIGQYVQFAWEGNGNLYNNDEQYYFIFLDTDKNPNTGQGWGGIGAEIKIIITSKGGEVVYFGPTGNVISQIGDLPVIYNGNKLYLSSEKEKIGYGNFNLYFESSGGTSYRDDGAIVNVNIVASDDMSELVIGSDSQVVFNPPLVNLPQKNLGVQLNTYIVTGVSDKVVSSNRIVYFVTHQEKDSRIGNLSQIISISSNGTARYVKEGYVLASSLYKTCDIITTKPTIIATGNLYGNVSSDNVIGVFPKNYSPAGNGVTFKSMIKNYSGFMQMVNLAYNLTSGLYGGYVPFDGAKQILSFEVSIDPANPFYCYNGNPLTPSPFCYMSSGGLPNYNLIIHEMGHNFGASDFASKGMRQLLYQNNKINSAGFGECVASLPVIYVAEEIYSNPQKYGLNKSSYEWNYYKNFLRDDVAGSQRTLVDFELLIRNNKTSGILDQSKPFDDVATFCSLFQQYSYNFTNQSNPYGNEVIKRFLNLFGNKELSSFRDSEVETYFSAAYSAAVGSDMRDKLRFWGFAIDDAYYDEIYSMMIAELNQTVSSKSILTCKKLVNYTTSWQSAKCNVSDCGEDVYVGCNKKTTILGAKRFREVCQRKEKYQTECSVDPSCDGALISKTSC